MLTKIGTLRQKLRHFRSYGLKRIKQTAALQFIYDSIRCIQLRHLDYLSKRTGSKGKEYDFFIFFCLSVAVGVCMLCTQNGWQEKMRSTITVRIARNKEQKTRRIHSPFTFIALSLLLKCVFIIHWKIYFSQKAKRVLKKRPTGRTNDS